MLFASDSSVGSAAVLVLLAVLYMCLGIPVTFHDFSEGVLLLLWSHPERQFVPVKGRRFHGHKPSFRV